MQPLNNLLIRSGRGDQQAFRQLYDATSPRLFALCRRLLRDEQLAEDALQEGFIKVWRHASSFTAEKAGAMTWMSTIIRNLALDKFRQMQHNTQSLDDMDYETLHFASTEPQPDKLQQLSDDALRLNRCLENLKPEQRECILQAFYHGHTHEQLADKLAKPLGTVKAWIRRGLEQLRGCLQ
jgi:RNA polymerase sigma-70 factor (ECF subfamily)